MTWKQEIPNLYSIQTKWPGINTQPNPNPPPRPLLNKPSLATWPPPHPCLCVQTAVVTDFIETIGQAITQIYKF